MGYGSDFAGIEDIDANWTFLEGDKPEQTALIQAVARRFVTPRGGNPWDQGYGYDLRLLVGSSIEPSIAETQISQEARKDERIAECRATVVAVGEKWTVVIRCTPEDGDVFSLTLEVTKVTVSLIKTGF